MILDKSKAERSHKCTDAPHYEVLRLNVIQDMLHCVSFHIICLVVVVIWISDTLENDTVLHYHIKSLSCSGENLRFVTVMNF